MQITYDYCPISLHFPETEFLYLLWISRFFYMFIHLDTSGSVMISKLD